LVYFSLEEFMIDLELKKPLLIILNPA